LAGPDADLARRADREYPVAVEMAVGQVLAIVNQKGGVGKTATAVNLGASLAGAGYPTLVVDCDAQSNATRSLGVVQDPPATLYHALVPEPPAPLAEVLVHTAVAGLDLVPAAPSLAGAEVELVQVTGREARLRRALEGVRGNYAFVLLDCPPSLGLMSVNAMVAADGVIVPVQCEYLALEGLGMLMRTLELVRSRLNPRLQVAGFVMTMYDARTNLSAQVVSEVGRHFPAQRFRTVIPRSVRLGEAPSYGETIGQYAPGSPGALAYESLAREVVERLDGHAATGGDQ
jgi:chromosome partitioning protein